MTLGLAIVLFAGILQGTFILPMNYTRDWKWEHNWFVFSLLGMLVPTRSLASPLSQSSSPSTPPRRNPLF